MDSRYNKMGIYRITNTVNGKSYIGKTGMNFGDRWDSHRSLLNSGKHDNRHLQHAWDKYGADAFEFAAVEEVDDVSMLNDLETRYIADYRSRGMCYNIHDGGDGGVNLGKHLSADTKRKIGEKNRANMLGRTASNETRQRMSASQLARYEMWSDTDRVEWGKMTSATASGYHWTQEARDRFSALQREKPNGAKFTADDIRSIRAERNSGAKLSELASKYGTTESYISNIVHRRRWANID